MAALLDLIDIIETDYRTELTTVLTGIDSNSIASTIEELATLTPKALGDELDTKVGDAFIDSFFDTTIKKDDPLSRADMTIKEHIIGDINNPTTRKEQERVDTVWNYFYNLYQGNRKVLIEYTGGEFQENVSLTATDNAFDLFYKQSLPNFKSKLEEDFYTFYAGYLINEANRYLRVNRRTYMAVGRIVEDDGDPGTTGTVPVGNARITVVSGAGVSIGGETRSDHNGYYNLYFSSLKEETGSIRLDISIEKNGFTTTSAPISYIVNEPEKVLVTEIVADPGSNSALIADVVTDLGLTLPGGLVTFLNVKNVTTLAGIRAQGLLINRKELKNIHSNAALNKLDWTSYKNVDKKLSGILGLY